MQLKDIAENKSQDETLEALKVLEKDFGVLALDPSIRFGVFNRCGYRVNFDEAKKLYDSYKKEE